MTVRIFDDINLRVVDDPEHDDKYWGHYILWPNSVRRDTLHSFTLPLNARLSRRPFLGRDM